MTYTSLRSESFTQDSGRVGTSLFTVEGGGGRLSMTSEAHVWVEESRVAFKALFIQRISVTASGSAPAGGDDPSRMAGGACGCK